jgi:hypothetical protein
MVAITSVTILAAGLNSSHRDSWLHTSGVDIFDHNGRRISLYGTNIASGQWQGVTLADIRTLKVLGFNAFRLNDLNWGLIQPYDETSHGIDESFFTTGSQSPYHRGLDEIVKWGIQENMYVILCLSWGEKWWLPPRWAFPGISKDTQRYAALINGTAAKEKTGIANTWRYIANRYKDVPNVIFELLNEPLVSDKSLAGSSYKSFNEDIISAIESVETQPHLKLIEPLKVIEIIHGSYEWMDAIDVASADVNKPNTAWATHHYDPMKSWDPNGSYWHESFRWHGQYLAEGWGNGTTYVAWRLIRVADAIHAWDKPWMVTEFGKNTTQTYWRDWFNVLLPTMAEYHVSGWMFFCYSSNKSLESGWNLNDLAKRREIMPLMTPYLITSTQVVTTEVLVLVIAGLTIFLFVCVLVHYGSVNRSSKSRTTIIDLSS